MQRSISFILLFLIFANPLWAEKSWADKKSDQAELYLKRAAQYYNNKKFGKAEQAFQKVLKMGVPLNPEFYYQYGRVQLKNRHPDGALESLNLYMQKAGKEGRFYKKAKSLSNKLQRQQNQKQVQQDNARQDSARQDNKEKRKKANKKGKPVLAIGTPKMVKIKKGKFIMGAKWGDEDQKPPFEMKINHDFAISKHEVTFAEYDRFAKETGRKLPDDKGWGRGKRPVINVSLLDAIAYTQWLSEKNNRNYRLPTEAEWEYVAKAKVKQKDKTYGHKNLIGRGDANCEGGRYFWEAAKTKEVGSYDPNPVGVHDVFGNVWEWTCSAYTRKYDGNETRCLASSKMEGRTVAVRGGSWRSNTRTLRPYIRYNNYPNFMNDDLGFRIVEVLK